MKNKVSFDFDSTLDRRDVQAFAKHLIDQGFEVWVTTSRGDDELVQVRGWNPDWNKDLWTVVESLKIPKERVNFTAWVDKWTVLNNKDFIWHLDDDEIEIEQMLINESDVVGVNVEIQATWLKICEDLLNEHNPNYKRI